MGIRAVSGKNGLAATVLVIVAALALLSGPASATSNDVIVDYRADGVIDASYSADELLDALTLWNQTGAANYGEFDSAISNKLDQLTLGVSPGKAATRPPEGEQRQNEVVPVPAVEPPAASPLPSPPPASATSRPPLVFVGLTALAALLLLAGVATALARRINLDRK